MAQWVDNVMRRFGYLPAKRKYAAAQINRLQSGWTSTNYSADSEIRGDLETLRARSRDLCVNDDYAKKFLQLIETNVVGTEGFALQAQAQRAPGQPDELDNAAIETAFYDWQKAANCDLGGRLTFPEMQRVIMKAVARDGEALIRRVRNSRFKYGYKLQPLDIDRLDVKYNDENPNSHIRMGVEFDDSGTPTHYHILTKHPGDYRMPQPNGVQRERVPASDVFHLYRQDRPEQRRGVPWLHSAMISLNQLHAYRESCIVASRIGASKMGFFISPDGSPPIGDEMDDQGNFITDADPGTFNVLPQGYDFKSFDPDYPQANYDAFVKSCLRGIASGMGVAYNSLSSDLEGVNFSSIRAGVLEERQNYMVLQNWFIETFLAPVFLDWIEAALLKGAILMATGSPLPAYKLPKYQAHNWQGRRWDWVDPQKDIDAKLTAMRAGLIDPQTIAAQSGLNLEDVIGRLVQANSLAAAAGLPAFYEKAPEPAPVQVNDTPLVKAAQIAADAQTRHLEIQRDIAKVTPPPVINVNPAPVTVNTGATRAEISEILGSTTDAIKQELADMQIIVNVPEQPAPVVNIQAPEVRNEITIEPTPVTLEATINPEVTISLPPRKTETTIMRDKNGEMIGSVAVEKDA